MNAIEYGSQGREDVPFDVDVAVSPTEIVVRITDRALSGPVPTDPEAPDIERKLAGDQNPRGWGLFLIEHMVDAMADDVRRFFETNTVSTFVCCQHAGLIMREAQQGGAIVNIGDWASSRPYSGYSAYFASKGAIPTLTRMFAVELAPQVRVNAVLPGPVLMPNTVSREEQARAVAGTLLKRPGRPQNVADAVAFLLANDFITGVSIPVDGGRTRSL